MFSALKAAVAKQFEAMKGHQLYRVMVNKDQLWDTYLDSFPEGTNPIYKTRREYDCQCCRHFIRAVGDVVTIIDGKLVSIWDVTFDATAGSVFQPVVDALATLVKTSPIDNVFFTTEGSAGVNKNFQQILAGAPLVWNHFFVTIPSKYVLRGDAIGPRLSDARSTKDVFLRSLKEITLDSVDTVLDLIAQNSLYRGEEHKFVLETFRIFKLSFSKIKTDAMQDLFAWQLTPTVSPSVSKIRNTSIGTLLTDLSEGRDLDSAVSSYEQKVAPTNYKRPTALVTKAMISKAQATIEELGFTSALERRYATIEDITINNILFADRKAKKAMNVFDELAGSVAEKTPNLDKIEIVSITDFLDNILPRTESLEVMFENRHASNLLSLIAPVDPTAKSMFKWPNNFSWSYTGEVADSIKERVKKAGRSVEGDLCCRLAWDYTDDLDFHMKEPDGHEIFYSNRRHKSACGGELDLDANGCDGNRKDPAENIFYADRRKMQTGDYILKVHNFSRRSSGVGFEVEVEFDGTVHHFVYEKVLRSGDTVKVATINYTSRHFKIVKSLPSTQASKQIWGIPTQTFHKVSVVMLSPNCWDLQKTGNLHYFFMLDGCLNDGKARGFFNEFLTSELDVHRKVFEMVGAKMKTEESANQLSGLGFSSTQRNFILARVKGSFTRTLKITF